MFKLLARETLLGIRPVPASSLHDKLAAGGWGGGGGAPKFGVDEVALRLAAPGAPVRLQLSVKHTSGDGL